MSNGVKTTIEVTRGELVDLMLACDSARKASIDSGEKWIKLQDLLNGYIKDLDEASENVSDGLRSKTIELSKSLQDNTETEKMYYFTKEFGISQLGADFYGTLEAARKEAKMHAMYEECNIFINEGENIVDVVLY